MQRAFILAAISAPFLTLLPSQGICAASSPRALGMGMALNACTAPPSMVAWVASAQPANGKLRGKTVAISTDDGFDLAATFYEPRTDHAPAALLIHDAGSDRNQLSEIADRLQKRGFGVLTLDLRGHGESKSEKLDWTKLSEEERPAIWQRAPRDVDAAATWLLGQESIHSTSLSIVGLRAGCALAARHAESDENVVSLLLIEPKAKDLGFNVEASLLQVEGLQTCVMAKRGADAQALVDSIGAVAKNWIDWRPVTTKSETILEDRKTPAKIAEWLGDAAIPKKGKR